MEKPIPAQTETVLGSFCVVSALLVGLLLVLPVRLRLNGSVTPMGGRGELCAAWTVIRVRVPMRLTLMKTPSLCLDFLRRDGAVKKRVRLAEKRRQSILGDALVDVMRIDRITAEWMLGWPRDAALRALAAAAAAGVTREALHALLPDAQVLARAVQVCTPDVVRVDLTGDATLRAGELLQAILHRKFMKK